MNLYYKLLYLFLQYDIYIKYKDSLDLGTIKNSYPIVWKLFQAIFKLYEYNTDKRDNNIDDLELVFLSLYPNENPQDISIVLQKIKNEGSQARKDLLVSYLEASRARQAAFRLGKLGIEVADGAKDPEALAEALETELELVRGRKAEDSGSFEFVTDNVEELYEKAVRSRGLRWRLDSLNKSLGSLRNGDFGFVFSRPETGKTTFLASETTFMAEQLQEGESLLWINNEEQGAKVMLRCVQAALDITSQDLSRDIRGTKAKFDDLIKHRIKLYDSGTITKLEIEKLFQTINPKLCVIDQIDKIKGFDDDRKDLELGNIYNWARELAKQYCPIIGICQADGTGEGVKALTMAHVANAKTSKQAEADFILGIGKSHNRDEQFIRYFNLSKNKLLGDDDTDPSRRHDFWEVEIDPSRARYRDFNYQ